MWPFRKKQAQETEVNATSFGQWLRAHRPPWAPFFALSDVEREHLASIGDAYLLDMAVMFGHALANPGAAQAGIAAHGGDDVALTTAVVDGLLAKLASVKPAEKRPTMAGIGARGGPQ
jgi:hypothetical protein